MHVKDGEGVGVHHCGCAVSGQGGGTCSQAQVVGGQPEHHAVLVENGGGLGSHHGGHAVPGHGGVDSSAQPGTASPEQVVEGQPEPHVIRVEWCGG